MENKNERENEFDGNDEFADTTAIDLESRYRVWRRSLGLKRGLGGSRGGDFSNGGIHPPGAGVQGEPETRV